MYWQPLRAELPPHKRVTHTRGTPCKPARLEVQPPRRQTSEVLAGRPSETRRSVRASIPRRAHETARWLGSRGQGGRSRPTARSAFSPLSFSGARSRASEPSVLLGFVPVGRQDE
eukprot:525697-Alexandrium_andersonii.AAC.1